MNGDYDFDDYEEQYIDEYTEEYERDGEDELDCPEADVTELVTLSDDPNDSYYYALHDVVDYNGKEYAVLIPQYGDYTEAIVREVTGFGSTEEKYSDVFDYRTVRDVLEIFRENNNYYDCD